MENKAHALAAGAFVLLVASLLVGLAMLLTRDTGVRHLYEMTTREAVSGLQPQAAVRYRGIAVGKVIYIGFDPQQTGNVLVRFTVENGTPMTKSTFATLGFQGVTGLAFVQLDDMGESKEALPTDDAHPARIPLKPGLLGRLTDQGTVIMERVAETTKQLNRLLGPENQKAFVETMLKVGEVAGGINKLAASLDATVTQRLDPALAAVPPLAAEGNKTLQALQGTSGELTKAANDFARVAQRLNEKGGTLDKLTESLDTVSGAAAALNATTLPRVNRASDDTARTARQASRAVDSVRDNPQALIYGNGPVPPGPGEPGFARSGANK
jgi:phospholipid/cholesterol/gamma-HCH transport system substrate-binding protein